MVAPYELRYILRCRELDAGGDANGSHEPHPGCHRRFPLLPHGIGSPSALATRNKQRPGQNRKPAGLVVTRQHARPGGNSAIQWKPGIDRRSGIDGVPDIDRGPRIGRAPDAAADPLAAGAAEDLTNSDRQPCVDPDPNSNPDPSAYPNPHADPRADAGSDSTANLEFPTTRGGVFRSEAGRQLVVPSLRRAVRRPGPPLDLGAASGEFPAEHHQASSRRDGRRICGAAAQPGRVL
jgi:hypothetical protein